jgi:hypothetical protein
MRSAKAGCRKNILPINRRAAFGSSPTRSQWRNVFDVTPVPPTISGNREGVSDRQGSPSCKWHRRLSLNDVSEYLVDRCPHVKCSRKVCDTVVFVNSSENWSKQRHKQAERDIGPNTAT